MALQLETGVTQLCLYLPMLKGLILLVDWPSAVDSFTLKSMPITDTLVWFHFSPAMSFITV